MKLWFYLVVLALITCIVYANSLHGDFIFDDQQLILSNKELLNIHTFADVLNFVAGWRQILSFTYGFNFYWTGLNTWSYHAVNIALHVLNVWLVYGILITLSKDYFASFAGSAIFAVHALFSGAVSYIAGRSSLLCATFYFAAILCFIKTINSTRRRDGIIYCALTACAAVMAWQVKQEAITLPAFMCVLLLLRAQSARLHRWWVIAIASAPVVTIFLLREQLMKLYSTVGENKVLVNAGFEQVLPLGMYIRTYITEVAYYFIPRFVFPNDLSIDPWVVPVAHWYSPEFLLSVIALAAIALFAIHCYKREPLLSLGIIAMLVSPLMAYSIIPLADVVLEHRTYIPGLCVAFFFAWIFQWIAKYYYSARWYLLCALIAVFGFMTIARNPVYADNLSLWEDAVKVGPLKPRSHFNLGQSYHERGRFGEAIREYERVLELKPDIYAAYSNMAAIYLDTQQWSKADEVLTRVTTLAPDFPEGWINIGVLYIRKKMPDEAITALNRSLQLNSDSANAYYNLGDALTLKGDLQAAVTAYRNAVRIRPDVQGMQHGLDNACARIGGCR